MTKMTMKEIEQAEFVLLLQRMIRVHLENSMFPENVARDLFFSGKPRWAVIENNQREAIRLQRVKACQVKELVEHARRAFLEENVEPAYPCGRWTV